jgi:hypothetical protein
MRRSAACFAAGLALAVVGWLIPAPGETAHTGCGAWRWGVKTLTDPRAGQVDLTPRQGLVDALRALPAPAPLSAALGRTAAEQVTYTVRAKFLFVKEEADSDFHVVIADPRDGATMIAEIPDPACAQGSRVQAQIARARAAFIRRFGMPSTTHFAQIPGGPLATVTGVLFFDEIHGQKGVAPNGVELHPVIDVK